MDLMDNRLKQLPGEPLPERLGERMRTLFHRRYQTWRYGQAAACSTLLLVGTWLFLPWLLSWLAQVQLPQSGLQVLGSLPGGMQANQIALQTLDHLSTFTVNLSRTASPFHSLGLAALTAGTLLGIRLLLPGRQA